MFICGGKNRERRGKGKRETKKLSILLPCATPKAVQTAQLSSGTVIGWFWFACLLEYSDASVLQEHPSAVSLSRCRRQPESTSLLLHDQRYMSNTSRYLKCKE